MPATHIERRDIDYRGVAWCGRRIWNQKNITLVPPAEATCRQCLTRVSKVQHRGE